MHVVFLCCCNGNISSVLVKKIIQEHQNRKIGYASIEEVVEAYDTFEQKFELLLAYGSAELIQPYIIKKQNLLAYIDVIWMCPQVRYLLPKMKQTLETETIAIHVLDMQAFGKANTSKLLEDILQALPSNKRL